MLRNSLATEKFSNTTVDDSRQRRKTGEGVCRCLFDVIGNHQWVRLCVGSCVPQLGPIISVRTFNVQHRHWRREIHKNKAYITDIRPTRFFV